MPQTTFRFHTLKDVAPMDDEALGEHLVEQVRRAIPKRQAGPALVLVRAERAEVMAAKSLSAPGLPRPVDGMGLFTRAQFPDGKHVRAIGLMGVFGYRARPTDTPVPTPLVFLEWEDGRWWQWRALMDPTDNALRTETETVLRAVDGIPRPRGLGGWWTRGRVLGGRPVFTRTVPETVSDVVH